MSDAVPTWLEDMGTKLMDGSQKQYIRDNYRHTLISIKNFCESKLQEYERDKMRKRK